MKPILVAIAILVQDEEQQISRIMNMVKDTDADYVIFFDDHSTDITRSKIREVTEKRIRTGGKIFLSGNRWEKTEKRFDVKKNIIHECLEEDLKIDWVLHIDADEVLDPFFVNNMKTVIANAPKSMSLSLKRINLPNSNNYPDYQTRLLRLDPDIEWRGEYHEKPYSKTENRPLVDLALDYKGNVNKEGIYYCIILEQFPIIHLPRRTDLKRQWW